MKMKDEWVRAAMIDDTVVVELLVRLKQQPQLAAAAAGPVKSQAVIPFRWGLRLPRSKQMTTVVSRKKDGDCSTRCSPTTPLSWSGGGGAASPSATVDGFEETSPHISRSSLSGVRSKVSAAVETACTSNKRSRRKKTFFELKQEESVLLLEKLNLKEELATVNASLKEQRAKNENLKRIKLDLNVQYGKKSNLASYEVEIASCSQTCRTEPSSSQNHHFSPVLPIHFKPDDDDDDDTISDSFGMQDAESNHDRTSFMLPDLNAMPCDEDQNTEALPGMR